MLKLPEVKTTTKDGIRVFDLTVAVDAYPGPTIDEWPANIQEGVYSVVEALGDQLQTPLAIIATRADEDIDADPMPNGKQPFFIHVTISEIVLALPEQAETLQ